MRIKLTESQYKKIRLMESSLSADAVEQAIWKIIARDGKSKDYEDFGKDRLGKTFIGILHFTDSGLERLYKKMGDTITKQYFGKSVKQMIDEIPTYLIWEEAEDFNNYRNQWKKFLSSPSSIGIQDEAAYDKFKDKLSNTPFSSEREIAIGISIANSSPRQLKELGAEHKWDAEKMLRDYCKSQCEKEKKFRSRCTVINQHFPYKGTEREDVFKATSCEDFKEKKIDTWEKDGPYDEWMDSQNESLIKKRKIKLTESQYKKVLLREFGEVVRDPKEWYLRVLEWVDSPKELDFETDEIEVVVYDKNGSYLGYYDKDQDLGFVVTEYGIGLEDEDEEPIDEQEGGESSGGGTMSKWDDLVSPVRGPDNTLDNSPWSVSPQRGPDNTLDNSPWSVSPVRGPSNTLT